MSFTCVIYHCIFFVFLIESDIMCKLKTKWPSHIRLICTYIIIFVFYFSCCRGTPENACLLFCIIIYYLFLLLLFLFLFYYLLLLCSFKSFIHPRFKLRITRRKRVRSVFVGQPFFKCTVIFFEMAKTNILI